MGKNWSWLWYTNAGAGMCVSQKVATLNTSSRAKTFFFFFFGNPFSLLKSLTSGSWGIADLRIGWSLLGHNFLSSSVDSAHLPISSLHCSPSTVEVLHLVVWAHRLGDVMIELCVIPVENSVLFLLLILLSVLKCASSVIADMISAFSPFLSRLWQTGTHRRPCCA